MTFADRMNDLKDQTDAYLEGFVAGVTAAMEAASREAGTLTERALASNRTMLPDEAQAFADIAAERDRARNTAVRLEQELAEKERELDETRQNMIKGVLLEVRRWQSDLTGADLTVRAATNAAAQKFGVTL